MDLMKHSCAPLLVTFLSFTFCTLAPAQQIAFTWDGPTVDNFDLYVKLVGGAE